MHIKHPRSVKYLHSHKGNVVLNGDPMNFGLVSAKDYADAVFLNGKGGSLEGGERGVVPSEGVNDNFVGHKFLPFLLLSRLELFGSVGGYERVDDLIEVAV